MGVVIAAQFWYIVQKDKENKETLRHLREEHEARVKDAKQYTDMALEIHERVTKALHTLGELLGTDPNGNATFYKE